MPVDNADDVRDAAKFCQVVVGMEGRWVQEFKTCAHPLPCPLHPPLIDGLEASQGEK